MWSRIQDSVLAVAAYGRIVSNYGNGCMYHNWEHVMAMYQYLEDTNVPYDEALDWAVLFHDIVYDVEPEKESRSARLFVEMCDKYSGFNLGPSEQTRVHGLIMKTRTHELTHNATESERAIIRADLHALADKAQLTRNFVKIMDESMNLYGCTVEEFAEKNILFMEGLKERMLLNLLVVDTNEEVFYKSVVEGIDTTIRLAQALKG